MSVRISIAPLAASLRTMCSAIAPNAPVIRIVLPERSMLIMIVRSHLFVSRNSGKHFVTGFGDQQVVLNARARAAFGNIHSRLNRDHHAGLEPGGFSGKNQKSRVVITKANVVAGVMGEKRCESCCRDLFSCQ